MVARYMPKTLAKTISYIGLYAPGEYGLYWDADGTMPWKEFYWVLQEDAALRFVRETHIRELNALGLELPFTLDGNSLRLRSLTALPDYPLTAKIPARLYFACRRKHYGFVLKHGLRASGRPLLALTSNKELALRLARRRDSEPILLEVLAQQALAAGSLFRQAGPELYLTEAVPLEHLLCPPIREQELAAAASNKKEPKPDKTAAPPSPGSFVVEPSHMHQSFPDQATPGKKPKKKGKGPEWKRNSRKERRKRTI